MPITPSASADYAGSPFTNNSSHAADGSTSSERLVQTPKQHSPVAAGRLLLIVRSRSVSACSDALASRRTRQLSLLCQLRLTAAGAARHSATFRATSCPARRLEIG